MVASSKAGRQRPRRPLFLPPVLAGVQPSKYTVHIAPLLPPYPTASIPKLLPRGQLYRCTGVHCHIAPLLPPYHTLSSKAPAARTPRSFLQWLQRRWNWATARWCPSWAWALGRARPARWRLLWSTLWGSATGILTVLPATEMRQR